MRPLELTLKGFQSYADQQTFDFRDRRLVGIVGPIGAGKSSLLDGIAFALYGRTPRAGKSTKGLINQRQGSAHVELWFQVEGETWRAVRALRRKGQSAHNLYRYAGDEPGAERLEEVTGEKLVTARVSELLGLDFEGFSRSVFLAQNRFADFLEATASQRDVVLKGVFALDRLDRMEEVAKTRRDGLRAELADLERLRGEVEADRSPLKEARAALKKATTTLAETESHRENARRLEVAAAEALGDGERAQSRLAELSGLAAQLPARDKTGVLLDRAAAGSKGQAEAEAALADATKGLEAARRHQAQTVKKTGGPAALERVGGRLEQLAALEKRAKDAAAGSKTARAGLERAQKDAAKAEKDLASRLEAQTVAAVAVESAAEATAAAEEAWHRATHEAGALALREGLVVGEPCPVCEQTVVVPPGAKKAPKADQVDRALDRARRTLGKAQAVNTDAATAHATALARVESTHKAHLAAEQHDKEALSAEESLAAERQGISDQLEKAVGKGKPSQVLERWRSQLDEADALVELKVAAENATRDHLATEQAARAGIGSELVQLATTVATLAGQLGGEIRPAADAAELSDSLDQLRKLWEERSAAAQDEHRASIKRREEAETAVAGILQQLGLTPGITLADAIKNAGANQARLQERVETLEGRAGRLAEAEKGSAETVQALNLYTTLADDLLPSRFLKFVLDEERRSLAQLGSEHFARMTRGRYRFTEDGAFNVMDLSAAGVERKADTLSGGESFIASLGLALALAEMVTRTGGRLDAFFLDEGFGSLDPEHLELAMEGIEALVGGDRLVVVVSHVPQLRERVEDLIELDKDPTTGDTRVVRS